MKFGSVALLQLLLPLLLVPESAWAFQACVPHRGASMTTTSKLFGFRQSYQYSLEQYTKTGKIEINGKQVDPNEAVQTINQDLQESQQQEEVAQQRLSSIEEQINDKVQEQTMTIEAFQAEIICLFFYNRKKQLEAKYKDMSEEAIQAANHEKMRAMDEFKARESQLQRDMDMLFSKLEEEKEHVRQNQDMTNRILATRIELDTELGILKKKYTEEAKVWESKLQAEKAAHVSDVAKAQAEVERLKKEVEEMSKERNSLGSLFKQSMKVMFGMDE
ncbi:hypothetical protein MHU86_17138 [Fragilaria crotonensis]|nr:hypothetical protein MHU86_17138 [Fragilaria crotonensis]